MQAAAPTGGDGWVGYVLKRMGCGGGSAGDDDDGGAAAGEGWRGSVGLVIGSDHVRHL